MSAADIRGRRLYRVRGQCRLLEGPRPVGHREASPSRRAGVSDKDVTARRTIASSVAGSAPNQFRADAGQKPRPFGFGLKRCAQDGECRCPPSCHSP